MQRTTTSIATHANLPIMPSTTREWKRLCFPGWCGEKLNHNKFREVFQVCHQRAMLKPIGSFHETPRVRTENAPSASSENGVRRHLEDARDPADPWNPPSWAWLESGERETINSQSSNRINCIYSWRRQSYSSYSNMQVHCCPWSIRPSTWRIWSLKGQL